MPRPRLPVEFAMFSAGVGFFLFLFGSGMAAYVVFLQGGGVFPWWCLKLAGGGLAVFLSTAAAYFLRIVQFVRQRGVEYDSFFWSLPLEGEDHPKDADDYFDEGFAALIQRWPALAFILVAAIAELRIMVRRGALHPLFRIDLGAVHNGGTHWSVGDVVILGGGSVVVIFIVGLGIRRIWAMQRGGGSE